jgi:hypothetical protein
MFKNNPIKNNTETTGFLLTITKIPQKMDANETKLNTPWFEPLVKVSFKRYKSNIEKIFFFPQWPDISKDYHTIENIYIYIYNQSQSVKMLVWIFINHLSLFFFKALKTSYESDPSVFGLANPMYEDS